MLKMANFAIFFTQPNFFLGNANTAVVHTQSLIFFYLTLYDRNFSHVVPEFFFALKLKHRNNAGRAIILPILPQERSQHSLIVRSLFVSFINRSVFLHFWRIFTHFSKRCERSYGTVGRIIDAVSVPPVLKS